MSRVPPAPPFLAAMLLSALAGAQEPGGDLVERGRRLFFEETFLGNGRTCGTCHLATEGFGLSPKAIAELPPGDPLFVFERVPALAGLEDGERIHGPRGLILENIDGFDKAPSFRGSPALINLALTAPFGLSGEFDDLREFTQTAIRQHFPRSLLRNEDPGLGPVDFRIATEDELDAMTAFMESLVLELKLDLMLSSAAFRGADPAVLRRGRDLFFSEDVKCFKCHGGPALADVDPSLVEAGVVAAPGNHRFNTGVAKRSEVLGVAGSHETEREFSTRPLVGVALRGAFFHDHSAATLEDAVNFYCSGCDENFFTTSPAFEAIGGMELNGEDRLAITAFLEALVEPAPECRGGPDCNSNEIADSCEILLYAERDCDGNQVPDSCESGIRDCDGNDIADECDITLDPGRDCNKNEIPDACDIASLASKDCNANELPDECEDGAVLDASEPSGLGPGRAVVLAGLRPQASLPFGICAAGDVNADGIGDLLAGAKLDSGPLDLPEVFVLFGKADLGRDGSIDMGALSGSEGFRVTSFDDRQSSDGFQVAAAGDFSGDGIDDFVVGDPDAHPGGRVAAGKAYVIFGAQGLGSGGALDSSALDGSEGLVLEGGTAIDRLGSSVAGGGDVNGDGFADVIVGAPFADPGLNAAGEAYVIFGGRTSQGAALGIGALDGTNGFRIPGVHQSDAAGSAVALGGDFNDDGIDDILVGARGADPNERESAGETYVIFGSAEIGAGGILRPSELTGANGFVIRGARELDANLLIGVSSAGDVNGDGSADIVIGSHNASPGDRPSAGQAYVIFGAAGLGGAGVLDVETLEAPQGFVINGVLAGDRLGAAVAALGDFEGDGFDDVGLGTAAGRDLYVLRGKPDIGNSGAIELDSIRVGDGAVLRVHGEEDLRQFFIASTLSAAGDVNGDGVPDIACGVRRPGSDPLADTGNAFILLGPPHPSDCDANGIPDACELRDGTHTDANGNGVPDTCEVTAGATFRRGDSNGDGRFDITDPVVTLNCLFLGSDCGTCSDAADSDDDGIINITDPIHSLGCQFLGSRCPGPPFEACGRDPTRDEVSCEAFSGCP